MYLFRTKYHMYVGCWVSIRVERAVLCDNTRTYVRMACRRVLSLLGGPFDGVATALGKLSIGGWGLFGDCPSKTIHLYEYIRLDRGYTQLYPNQRVKYLGPFVSSQLRMSGRCYCPKYLKLPKRLPYMLRSS